MADHWAIGVAEISFVLVELLPRCGSWRFRAEKGVDYGVVSDGGFWSEMVE